MATEEPNDAERVERLFRIVELKGQADELAGGEMKGWVSPDCPPEIEEQFWERVVAFESAPETTNFDQLARAGVEMLPPEEMDDLELSVKLWEVIEALAQLRVYLECTDHLSDRELYTYLYQDGLRETVPDFPPEVEMNYHLSPVGSGSDEDTALWLKYYADEDTRQQWLKDFPDYELPPHEDPRFDRDRHLPHAVYDFDGDEGEDLPGE